MPNHTKEARMQTQLRGKTLENTQPQKTQPKDHGFRSGLGAMAEAH